MERRSRHTINTLLTEMKQGIPALKKGMIFETMKSVFPANDIPREKKNITLEGTSFTKPMACNAKDKEKYIKEESPVASFFAEHNRGDFLKAVKVENDTAYCINISLKEEIREEYYKEELIPISYLDIANNTYRIYRRNIQKFFDNN